jgi:hypothetical protein
MSPIEFVSRSRIRVAVLIAAITAAVAVAAGITVAGAAAGPRAPQLGKTVDVVPVSGQAFVTAPGRARQQLVAAESVPVGTVVDATRGSVRVIGATAAGAGTQSGTYSGGEFQVLQPAAHGHAIEVRLVGGDFSVCGKASAARAPTKQVMRQLSTKAGYGPITSGRVIGARARRYGYGAAAADAISAVWTTIDTCQTTNLNIKRGHLIPVSSRPVRMSAGGCGGARDARVVPSKVLELLHAGAKGKFRACGKYSAATIRGSADLG